jgi:hypothetical protein|tara:strand:- start:590 stop:853 length:264 start_codon:yes stop_codon:yes gene_type:complete
MTDSQLNYTKKLITTIIVASKDDPNSVKPSTMLDCLKYSEDYFETKTHIKDVVDFTYDLMEFVLNKLNVKWSNDTKVSFVNMAVNNS